MSSKRKVVDAKQDSNGNISHVKLEGNQNFTPKEKAIEMTEKGQLENVHVVTRTDGSQHLRTNPDSKTKNNLDEMAQG